MEKIWKDIETKVVHAGEPDPLIGGAVSMPIFQSSTFEYQEQASYHDIRYIRLNNTPNHNALHAKIAALENAESALVAASGMAAISTALLTLLVPGDHLLAQDCLYGGTHDLITKDLADYGIAFDFIDGDAPESWKDKLRPETKVIYMESITNPMLQVADLRAAARFAGENGLVSIIDNTFATPVNFQPIGIGFDLVVHSCSKYLNGHSDIVAGAIAGSSAQIEKIKHKLNHLGGTLDPHACFLLHRGMKTLALRVRFQNNSALSLANFLESHSAVEKVCYPGLESHTQYRRAQNLFRGFGGMLSFELKGGVEEAERFIKRMTLPVCAPSLGGVETLVTRPCTTSHSGMAREERLKLGITDTLIRLSVGIESADDLTEDMDRALKMQG